MSAFAYPPPADGKPFRLTMGLRDLKESDWIEAGADLLIQLPQRNALLNSKRDAVFASVPGYDQPARQFADAIVLNLSQFHGDTYDIAGDRVAHRDLGITVDLNDDHPFVQLVRVIGEDLCLMSLVDDKWNLTVGAVLFPSRWNLLEKVGKDIDAIHAPVPGYDQSLINYMTPVFDRLTRQVWRLNWTLHATNELHQIERSSETALPDHYFWRTERQTLTRDGDHVLFTIRNRAEPLAWIFEESGRAAAFADTLESMTAETRDYKGLSADLPALIEYLRG